MSLDTLPEQTGDDAYTPAVRSYLTLGIQKADEAIEGARRHLDMLDARRAELQELVEQWPAAERHLADLVRSREQLLALIAKGESREPGEEARPTHVCKCGRIAFVDPARGPIHEGDGTHLPALEACQMPPLGFLFIGGPERAAGGPEAGA